MTQALTFTIREALAADESVIGELDELARTEGTRHRGASHLHDSLGGFGERWSARETTLRYTVASIHAEVVGFTTVRLGERPVLEQVFVHASARGLGVGAALLRDAVHRYGADHLDALSLPGDRLTKNLYERAGLKARLIVASAL